MPKVKLRLAAAAAAATAARSWEEYASGSEVDHWGSAWQGGTAAAAAPAASGETVAVAADAGEQRGGEAHPDPQREAPLSGRAGSDAAATEVAPQGTVGAMAEAGAVAIAVAVGPAKPRKDMNLVIAVWCVTGDVQIGWFNHRLCESGAHIIMLSLN